jgi:hypothetical protein
MIGAIVLTPRESRHLAPAEHRRAGAPQRRQTRWC